MDTNQPKAFIFVLMPFDSAFGDIYSFGIKGACTEAGAYCERLDEQIFTENMLDRIYNQIAKADLIIADMTGRNPNVFYETGYAHALGKRVVLLTQRAEDIPFDLRHYPHIVYGGEIRGLKDGLLKKIKALLLSPEEEARPLAMAIRFSIEGQDIRNTPVVRPHFSGVAANTGDAFAVPVDIHYPAASFAPKESFNIGLVIASQAGEVRASARRYSSNEISVTHYDLPDGKHIAFVNDTIVMSPGGLMKIPFYLAVRGLEPDRRHEVDLAIRIFRDRGATDIPFRLAVEATRRVTPLTGM